MIQFMADWQFTEIITTHREYQELLVQLSMVLITGSSTLIFINRNSRKTLSFLSAIFASVFGILSIVWSFGFKSRLIDIIPTLTATENGSSLTDAGLQCNATTQLVFIIVSLIFISIAGACTPKNRDSQ